PLPRARHTSPRFADRSKASIVWSCQEVPAGMTEETHGPGIEHAVDERGFADRAGRARPFIARAFAAGNLVVAAIIGLAAFLASRAGTGAVNAWRGLAAWAVGLVLANVGLFVWLSPGRPDAAAGLDIVTAWRQGARVGREVTRQNPREALTAEAGPGTTRAIE